MKQLLFAMAVFVAAMLVSLFWNTIVGELVWVVINTLGCLLAIKVTGFKTFYIILMVSGILLYTINLIYA